MWPYHSLGFAIADLESGYTFLTDSSTISLPTMLLWHSASTIPLHHRCWFLAMYLNSPYDFPRSLHSSSTISNSPQNCHPFSMCALSTATSGYWSTLPVTCKVPINSRSGLLPKNLPWFVRIRLRSIYRPLAFPSVFCGLVFPPSAACLIILSKTTFKVLIISSSVQREFIDRR